MRKSFQMRHKRQTMQVKEIIKSRTRESVAFKYQVRVFGVLLGLFEIMICIVYGIFLSYLPAVGASNTQTPFTNVDRNQLIVPAFLLLLTLLGMGLMNSYLSGMKLVAMGFVLLTLAVSMQLYLLVRMLWNAVGISSTNILYPLNATFVPVLELLNSFNDRQLTDNLVSNSLADAAAAALSIVIALKALIGRIGPLELLLLSWIGIVLYEINNQILWKLWITDCGYGMRVFLFGSITGLVSSLILWKRDTTLNSINYSTNYFSQTYSFLGSVIVWTLFPVLIVSDLYRNPNYMLTDAQGNITRSTDNNILTVAVLNTFLSLLSSSIGAFCASMLINNRFLVHDVIHSIFAGAIVFTSTADIYFNPALPLGIGTVFGFGTVFLNKYVQFKINKKGILDTYNVFANFLIPGVSAGVLSAIFEAVGPPVVTFTDSISNETLTYGPNALSSRNNFIQGGFQMIGLAITMAIAAAAGLISGLLFKLINSHKAVHQFVDLSYYESVEKQD